LVSSELLLVYSNGGGKFNDFCTDAAIQKMVDEVRIPSGRTVTGK